MTETTKQEYAAKALVEISALIDRIHAGSLNAWDAILTRESELQKQLTALRDAPEAQPVAWRQLMADGRYFYCATDPREAHDNGRACEPLYTAPQAKAAEGAGTPLAGELKKLSRLQPSSRRCVI